MVATIIELSIGQTTDEFAIGEDREPNPESLETQDDATDRAAIPHYPIK